MKVTAILAIIAMLGSATTTAARESALVVEPIVRLMDGQIAACGVGFSGDYKGARITAEFVLAKSALGPLFQLSGRYHGPEQLADIALETDFASTVGLMPRPVSRKDGTLFVQSAIPGYTGSEFVRSLMVSGGRLRLGLAGPTGNVVDLEIVGPFSQQVRASYLNCAGDLERP